MPMLMPMPMPMPIRLDPTPSDLRQESAPSMTLVTLTVNSRVERHEVESRTLLVDYLREHCHLKGTHVGCDTSQCGCCTVLVNGDAIKACTVLAVQLEGAEVTTIEGLAAPDLHPVQKAFTQCHALQCGFCTPGMILSSVDLLAKNPNPSEEDIIEGLEGNFCRCTGYLNIVQAVKVAAQQMQGTPQS
jgi:aerobic carbon-monoxide dehydrogenase small subunit